MHWLAVLLFVALGGCADRAEQSVRDPAVAASAARPTAPDPVSIAEPAMKPASTVVMDVMQLVGKSESDVAALLGQPTGCEDIHRARMCRYRPHGNEVMFVAGKADMITVLGMADVPFDEHALVALGFAPVSPDHADADGIRWESLPGLEELTVFPAADNTVRYAYVKVGRH